MKRMGRVVAVVNNVTLDIIKIISSSHSWALSDNMGQCFKKGFEETSVGTI